MFSVVDTDGNGALSNKEIQAKMDSDDELKTLVKDAGMNPADLFEELDADGDGSVTMLEFLKLLDVMAQEEREKLAELQQRLQITWSQLEPTPSELTPGRPVEEVSREERAVDSFCAFCCSRRAAST